MKSFHQGVLGARAKEAAERITPEIIQAAVANHWGVPISALSSKRRTKDLTVPRQVAMYLIRELLELPLVKIGYLFGGRDHSTVIHSVRKVEDSLAADPAFLRRVNALKEELSRSL